MYLNWFLNGHFIICGAFLLREFPSREKLQEVFLQFFAVFIKLKLSVFSTDYLLFILIVSAFCYLFLFNDFDVATFFILYQVAYNLKVIKYIFTQMCFIMSFYVIFTKLPWEKLDQCSVRAMYSCCCVIIKLYYGFIFYSQICCIIETVVHNDNGCS